jgi:HPt (histidine-containing phosphotransfer) domain-containing protein
MVNIIIASIFEDIPLQIQALLGCVEKSDAVSAERQAHTIKGAGAKIGDEALRSVTYGMEKNGKSGNSNYR